MLPYVEFTVGENVYKLKLIAKSAVRLENKLQCSLLEGMKCLDRLSVCLDYLSASLEAFHPKNGEVCLIYDDYVAGGGTLGDLVDTIVDVMRVSGFFKKETAPNAGSL